MSGVKTSLKLAEIQQLAPQVIGLETEFISYVDEGGPLSESEGGSLNWFLAETFEPDQFGASSFFGSGGRIIEVGPRLGRS
ncbi:MAG: hypothetical protein PHQ42_04475, partial [Patescibacteria group bacterium]|nr:hypothetical protein [Patescibacteria group bacterium]